MATLTTIKLAVDLMLMMVLILFALKQSRRGSGPSNSAAGLELENSIRTLIKEAETQGRQLNEQLAKREQSLRRLLQEIDSYESKAESVVIQTKEQTQQLQLTTQDAAKICAEIKTQIEAFKTELAIPVIQNQPEQEIKDLRDLYSAAEEMLRAGKELKVVSKTTSLPVEEIRKLSLLIEKERIYQQELQTEVVVPQQDPRLGVLGNTLNTRNVS